MYQLKLILLNNFVHFDGLENLQGLEWLNVFVLLTVTQNLTNMIYFLIVEIYFSKVKRFFLSRIEIFYQDIYIESIKQVLILHYFKVPIYQNFL